jgi:hypothetical protein
MWWTKLRMKILLKVIRWDNMHPWMCTQDIPLSHCNLSHCSKVWTCILDRWAKREPFSEYCVGNKKKYLGSIKNIRISFHIYYIYVIYLFFSKYEFNMNSIIFFWIHYFFMMHNSLLQDCCVNREIIHIVACNNYDGFQSTPQLYVFIKFHFNISRIN